jgi:hypothetical protein
MLRTLVALCLLAVLSAWLSSCRRSQEAPRQMTPQEQQQRQQKSGN